MQTKLKGGLTCRGIAPFSGRQFSGRRDRRRGTSNLSQPHFQKYPSNSPVFNRFPLPPFCRELSPSGAQWKSGKLYPCGREPRDGANSNHSQYKITNPNQCSYLPRSTFRNLLIRVCFLKEMGGVHPPVSERGIFTGSGAPDAWCSGRCTGCDGSR